MALKPMTMFLFGVLPIFSISLVIYFVKLAFHQPYFTSFLYQITTNNLSLFYIATFSVLLLWFGCFVLHRISVGHLDSDEREDVGHHINYILADVMNFLLMRAYIDFSSGSIILLTTFIRCLLVIAKVRITNLGRYLTPLPYFRLSILLNAIFWFSVGLLFYHFRLIINVTSPKSLFAYELVTCTISILDKIGKFIVDTIAIFFNNCLAPLDPHVLYPTQKQLQQRTETLRRNLEFNFGQDDEDGYEDGLVGDTDGTALDDDEENPEIQPEHTEKPSTREEKIQIALDTLLAQEAAELAQQLLDLPAWYRHFGRFYFVYDICSWVSKNQTLLNTLIQLISSFIQLAVYTHILIRYYKIILPIFTLRRTITAISRTIGGYIKMKQIFQVKNNMDDMFRRISIYESAFLSSDEVCGVCLVDFADEALDGKSSIDGCKMKNFHDYLVEKRHSIFVNASKKAHNVNNAISTSILPSDDSNSNNNPIPSINDINIIPQDHLQAYMAKKKILDSHMATYKADQSTVGYLSCCHYFHHECIGEWLRRDARCPVCRQTSHNNFKQQPIHSTRQSEHDKQFNKLNKKNSIQIKQILANKLTRFFQDIPAPSSNSNTTTTSTTTTTTTTMTSTTAQNRQNQSLEASGVAANVNKSHLFSSDIHTPTTTPQYNNTSIDSNNMLTSTETTQKSSTFPTQPPTSPVYQHFSSLYSFHPHNSIQQLEPVQHFAPSTPSKNQRPSSFSNLSTIDTSNNSPTSSTTPNTSMPSSVTNLSDSLSQTNKLYIASSINNSSPLLTTPIATPITSTTTTSTTTTSSTINPTTQLSATSPLLQQESLGDPTLLLSPTTQDLKRMEREQRLKAQQLLRDQALNARTASLKSPSSAPPVTSTPPSSLTFPHPTITSSTTNTNTPFKDNTKNDGINFDRVPSLVNQSSLGNLILPLELQNSLMKQSSATVFTSNTIGQSISMDEIYNALASDYYQEDSLLQSPILPTTISSLVDPISPLTISAPEATNLRLEQPAEQPIEPQKVKELTVAQQKQAEMFAAQIQSIQTQICQLFQRKEHIIRDSTTAANDIDAHLLSLQTLLEQSIQFQRLCIQNNSTE